MIKDVECYYCRRNVTEGQRLRISLIAERAWRTGNDISSKGFFETVILCSSCARKYFELVAMEHSNTSEHLKLILQQILPPKRIEKWNPTRRYS